MSDYCIRYMKVQNKDLDGFAFVIQKRKTRLFFGKKFVFTENVNAYKSEVEALADLDLFRKYGDDWK